MNEDKEMSCSNLGTRLNISEREKTIPSCKTAKNEFESIKQAEMISMYY